MLDIKNISKTKVVRSTTFKLHDSIKLELSETIAYKGEKVDNIETIFVIRENKGKQWRKLPGGPVATILIEDFKKV